MKTRYKIIIAIAIIIIGLTATGVLATVSDLSTLKGTGTSKIGQVYTLTYSSSLKGNTGAYCIQRNKGFSGETKYVVKSYVEINGKQAKLYESKDADAKTIINNLNAQVAYILNQNEGYGTHDEPTDAQNALWYIANDWTTTLFGNTNYTWSSNAGVEGNSINEKAIEYANNVGNQLASESEGTTVVQGMTVVDKTNKDQLSIMTVPGYYRVGPFRWEFNGTLQSITVIGDNGTISNSNVRFVKYTGTTANVVEASDISTGEAFYVDVSQSSGATKLTGLKLKTSSSATNTESTVYTAKIWFLQASDSQNIIYVDVGESKEKPSEGTGTGEYDVPFSINIGLKKVDDRDTNKPLVGVGFTFSATIQTYDVIDSEDHYKQVSCSHVSSQEYTDENNVYHPAVYQHEYDLEFDWTQYTYDWVDHTMYLNSDNTWSDTANTYYTDNAGLIAIEDITYPTKTITNESYKGESYKATARLKEGTSVTATEVSNPYYGYTIGDTYKVELNSGTELKETTAKNHQEFVKLSGYVWIDSNTGKTDIRTEEFESGEEGFNGITVYLRDTNGNEIKRTTTSELGLYSEIQGGEYQFVDVDLDRLQAGDYYVEFEYCGIDYQSVVQVLDKNNGSKAIDTNTRNVLDSKFTSVNSSGTQSLGINGVTVNYNNVSDHVSTVNNHTGCNVYARTNEAGYDLYSGFTPTSEEIRYVNLGLYRKPQVDYALSQDLYDVRVDVNGFSHVYRYGTTRYTNNGQTIDEESSWNVGVKFQKNNGTYARPIYTADAEYEAPNHKDNEIKVYVTYKIALRNESAYLGRINNIVDYCDSRYELVAAGTSIDDNDNITGNVSFGGKAGYNNEYSKYIIDVNSVVKPGETNYMYVQFKMDRTAVLTILNNGELLNNVVEINSYTTFKNNNLNTPVSVIDQDSVIGNTVPGQINTYEDDTDAARSLQLELKNARAIVGTVFVDSTGKDANVYTGQERIGNGLFDNGETTISGVKVTLHEVGKDDSSYDGERKTYETTTDDNGNFEIVGYIPGNYVLTYTWGNQTYKVQYYKGTIYDESRDQSNTFWYRDDNVDTRKTDALDSSNIRETIDNEMEALKYNTLENEINKAYDGGSEYIKTTTMDSSTPTMSFSVEYLTTVTDGTVDQVKFTVKNVDFGIVERPKQQLEFSKRVSAFKITLANGQVLVDAEVTEDGKLKGSYDHTTYNGPLSDFNGLIRTEMDTELIEGATIEIIYTMEVTNVSELDYDSKEYYYYGNKNNADLVRTSVTGLVDYIDGKVSILDDKWDEKDQAYLVEVNASQSDNLEYLNTTRTYLTSHLAKALAPNESNTVTLKTSKLLTSTDDNTFDNKAEIVEVTKTDKFNTGTPVKVEWNEDEFNFNIANAEAVAVVPSTGEDRSYALPIIIGISSLMVLGVGIFVIKKFVIDNK